MPVFISLCLEKREYVSRNMYIFLPFIELICFFIAKKS